MTSKLALTGIAIAVAAATTPATAAVYTLNGSLALTDPTFNRPLDGNPPTGLSAVGTAVHYDTVSFTVDLGGSYTFLLSSGAGGFDTFLGLYSPSFAPGSPLANVLQTNDDLGSSLTMSGFTRTLTAGTSYVSVLTAFNNADVGAYTFTITGPGTVTPAGAGAVPEPATWAMLTIGFGAVGYAARRRGTARLAARAV